MLALCVGALLSWALLLYIHRDRILKIDDESLELRHATRYDPVLVPFKFLIRPYVRHLYMYDVYDMLRRVIFVSILPILPLKNESERAVIGCIFAVFALMISSNLKPYQKEVTNALNEALQYLIFFTFFLFFVLPLEGVHVMSDNGEGISTVGVLALLAQIIVILISFRPGLKVIVEYRIEEARLQSALEAEIKKQAEGEGLYVTNSNLRALTRAQEVDIDVLPRTMFMENISQPGSWLHESKGGAEDIWLGDAINEKLGIESTMGKPLLQASKTTVTEASLDGSPKTVDNETNARLNGNQLFEEFVAKVEVYIDALMLETLSEYEKEKAISSYCELEKMVSEQVHKKSRMITDIPPRDPRQYISRGEEEEEEKATDQHSSAALVNNDPVDVQKGLRMAADALQAVLGFAMTRYAGEAELVRKCDNIMNDICATLSPLYNAVFSLIVHTEHQGFESYEIEVAGLKATASGNHHKQKSRGKKLLTLVNDAIFAKVRVDPIVQQIADTVLCKVVVPRRLKPLERVIERTMMNPDDTLTAHCDIVRYRFIGTTMGRIASICAEFHKSPNLRVVNVVDGFAREGIESWRSCLIYFSYKHDRHHHICEAEVCHAKLADLRYGRVENGSEMYGLSSSMTGSFGMKSRSSISRLLSKKVSGSFSFKRSVSGSSRSNSFSGAAKAFRRWSFQKGRGQDDDSSFEHLHLQLRSAREVLKRLGMEKSVRVAHIKDHVTDSNSVLLANYVRMGISEEDLEAAGVEPDILKLYFRNSLTARSQKVERKLSRLQSLHLAPSEKSSTEGERAAGEGGLDERSKASKSTAKVSPAQQQEAERTQEDDTE